MKNKMKTETNEIKRGDKMKPQTVSMSSIRARSTNHWFDADTMRFFATQLPKHGYIGADGSAYFVTSERFNSMLPRRYSVRVMKANGTVDTIGEFQGFERSIEATKKAKALAAGER